MPVKLKSALRKFTVATMTWLTVTEFLYHNWPLICSTCRKHFLVRSLFMTYHWVCKRNTTGATSEAETAYHSEAPEFIPVFWGVRVARCLIFCVMYWGSLFVLFRLAIVLSVLLFTYSDYPFGIFLLFLFEYWKMNSIMSSTGNLVLHNPSPTKLRLYCYTNNMLLIKRAIIFIKRCI